MAQKESIIVFLYDWQKVYDEAKGNIVSCNRIMEMLITKRIPINRYDPIYMLSQKNFSGRSFMLHPDVLLYNSYKYTNREIAEYYALAALRSLPEYFASQKTTLDLLHLPVGLEIINENRLLSIDEHSVHFLYEEVTKEKLH